MENRKMSDAEPQEDLEPDNLIKTNRPYIKKELLRIDEKNNKEMFHKIPSKQEFNGMTNIKTESDENQILGSNYNDYFGKQGNMTENEAAYLENKVHVKCHDGIEDTNKENHILEFGMAETLECKKDIKPESQSLAFDTKDKFENKKGRKQENQETMFDTSEILAHRNGETQMNEISVFATTELTKHKNDEKKENQELVLSRTTTLNPASSEKQEKAENQGFMCDKAEMLKYYTNEKEGNQELVFDTTFMHENDVKQENQAMAFDMLEKTESEKDIKQVNQKLAFGTLRMSGHKKEKNTQNQELAFDLTEVLKHKLSDEKHELELDTRKTFENKNIQQNEKKRETRENQFSCGFCSKQFFSALRLMEHMLKHKLSPNKGLKCVICEKSYRGLRSHILRAHMSVPETAIATLPRSEENKSDDFETYIVSRDGRKAYKCKTCGEKFWYIAQVTKHVWKHTKITPYQCAICGAYKRAPGSLKKHMLIHEGKCPECSICNKKFSSDRTLRNHMSLHTGERTHKCEICGENFRLRMSLRRHQLNKHPGESSTAKSQRTCHECGRVFVNAMDLKLHMYTHSDKKLFDCSSSGLLFRQPDCRDQHQKTHSNDQSHICTECGDTFNTSRILKLHCEAQHNIEPQHACQTCGKVFKYRSELSRHKVQHSGEKRFKCEICEKAFVTSYSLQCHSRLHSGVKEFSCCICDARYSQRKHLNRHMAIKHKSEDVQEMPNKTTTIKQTKKNKLKAIPRCMADGELIKQIVLASKK